jgi:5-methylcytosine-specific restriction protein B
VSLTDARPHEHIQAVVDAWKERCLLEDGSLLYDEEQLWSPDNLAQAHHNIAEQPLLDGGSFIEKLERQLAGERRLVLLGAELLVVYYLFAWDGSVGAATKRDRVAKVLAWANAELPEDSEAWQALGEAGIGHPGQFFLLRPDIQLGFLLDFALRLKKEPASEQRQTLSDPWRLRDFADAGEDQGASGMRHILLHLLHPDAFEPISSGQDKQRIASTYADLVDDDIEDLDEQLVVIRRGLAELLGQPSGEVEFYREPLASTWGGHRAKGDANLVDGLELKKQVVLFGPPGTSKTYEAKQIAGQIIRRHALRQWGPVEYFQRQDRIEELIANHVRRLQLHPAYSYEEFIRGLRLRDGSVAFEDGYLLRLVDEINDEQIPEAETPLPWVLILDELNRADLSRVFGEAFSVLEDRNEAVELPGSEPGQPPRKIVLPDRLYVIGTMNLIDQSLEQIDFALRRRFLWWRSGFDRARLAAVLPELWEQTDTAHRYPWTRISGEVDLFTSRAELLNEQIGASSLLGRDYELGHTYFFDVIGLLAKSERLHRKTRASQFLWNKKGEAHPPVGDLWRMSLEPLIDQYLQGIDADSRKSALTLGTAV